MSYRFVLTTLPLLASVLLSGCKEGINLFSISDDLELGQDLQREINGNSQDYPVIDRADAPEAYAALDTIVDRILASDGIEHRDELAWEFALIDDDDVVNAFAAPGGYVWIYSGLIHELADEDSFAGVIAHEIGHADGRHSTEQLTRIYGVTLLLDLALGENRGALSDIAEGLAGLEFSRANERDADERSVTTLCDTPYAADAVATFFEGLGNSNGPAFLSTHPAPENRVSHVRDLAEDEGCSVASSGLTDFVTLQNALR